MSKCRYDLSASCNNADCTECILIQIRQEVLDIPTHIDNLGYYKQREAHAYKYDVLEILGKWIHQNKETP